MSIFFSKLNSVQGGITTQGWTQSTWTLPFILIRVRKRVSSGKPPPIPPFSGSAVLTKLHSDSSRVGFRTQKVGNLYGAVNKSEICLHTTKPTVAQPSIPPSPNCSKTRFQAYLKKSSRPVFWSSWEVKWLVQAHTMGQISVEAAMRSYPLVWRPSTRVDALEHKLFLSLFV